MSLITYTTVDAPAKITNIAKIFPASLNGLTLAVADRSQSDYGHEKCIKDAPSLDQHKPASADQDKHSDRPNIPQKAPCDVRFYEAF